MVILALRIGTLAELVTGIVLISVPSVALDALIGSSNGDAPLVGRVLGAALLALGVAGALTDTRSLDRGIVFSFFVYNASTTTILAVASVAGSADGILLWPVAFLHAVIAVAIAVGWRRGGKRRPPTRMQ